MKKKAFTLVEILLTLGIIGVVAALTLPNLVGNTNSKTNSVVLKSTYQQFGDALSQAMLDQGVRHVLDLDYDGESNADKLSAFLNKYLDIAKNCGGSATGCFADSYKTLGGGDASNVFSFNGQPMIKYVKLSNGASLALRIDLVGGDSGSNAFIVDVNGPSKPNTIGVDLFAQSISDDGSLGTGVITSENIAAIRTSCTGNDGANSAVACLNILQSRNWDIENYLQ